MHSTCLPKRKLPNTQKMLILFCLLIPVAYAGKSVLHLGANVGSVGNYEWYIALYVEAAAQLMVFFQRMHFIFYIRLPIQPGTVFPFRLSLSDYTCFTLAFWLVSQFRPSTSPSLSYTCTLIRTEFLPTSYYIITIQISCTMLSTSMVIKKSPNILYFHSFLVYILPCNKIVWIKW